MQDDVAILFTTSDRLLSRLIRSLTNSKISHVAVRHGAYVIHSTTMGPEIISYQAFCKKARVIDEVPVYYDGTVAQLHAAISKYDDRMYDYLGLLYLGIRYIGRKWLGLPLPKANLWQVSGMFTCTEFVTVILWGRPNSLITPEQLHFVLTHSILPNPPTVRGI
jgi:hypothetical protein